MAASPDVHVQQAIGDGSTFDVADQIYEPITGQHTMVNHLNFVNITGSDATLDLEIWPLGVEASAYRLVKGLVIPANEGFEFDGTMILNSGPTDGDKLRPKATANSIDVQASLLNRADTDLPKGVGFGARNIGTTFTQLYVVPASRKASVDFLQFLNVSGSAITLDLEHRTAGDDPLLLDTVSLEPNEIFVFSGTLHMLVGHTLHAKSSAATSVDAVGGSLEFVS